LKKQDVSKNINAGHRQRLRQRFLTCGIKALAPHEILELLLTYSIPQKDVKPLAKSLLERFDTLYGVLNSNADLLMEQHGIKENSAALLSIWTAINEYFQEMSMQSDDIIANPLAAIRYLKRRIGSESQEVLALLFLDSTNHSLGCELFSGRSKSVSFYPQNIARRILQNNASGVIVAHDHPSGNCYPSDADLNSTRILKNYLEQLELKLVDHLIITRFSHLSLLNRIGCIFKNYIGNCIDPERTLPYFQPPPVPVVFQETEDISR
jgi:DNA repair protein RadC